MSNAPRIIGVHTVSWWETAIRTFEGALQFADEVGGLVVREFRVWEEIDPRSHPPPWKGRADGVLVMIGKPSEITDGEMADWVLDGGVPAVSLGAEWLDPRVPSFVVGADSLAELAAEHLTGCGCRSFLYVGFFDSTGSAERGKAFGESLARRGRQLVEHASTGPLMASLEDEVMVRAETGLIEQLKCLPKPLGVWTLNDIYGRGVYTLCGDLGLAIPDVVKVLGVDDMRIARTSRPPLSSIRTPREQIGRSAMQTPQKMLDGRPGPRKPTVVRATELVARASTVGALPGSADMHGALDYIARHACAGLTVDQLVEAMSISRSSLHEHFQRMIGRSPGEEIQRVRLARAKELLLRTQLSVSRIAAMVGFEETSAFSKFFHRETGLAPRAYRQNKDAARET